MKRAALVALAIVVFLMPLAAEAQQARKVPRVGVLASGDTQAVEAFKQGLRDLGYVEGQNIVTVWRFYEGRADRAPALAAQLLRAELDVLVATGPPAFEAAKELTATIPIVALGGTDPVGTGLVVSLARPGGNITSLTIGHPEEIGNDSSY